MNIYIKSINNLISSGLAVLLRESAINLERKKPLSSFSADWTWDVNLGLYLVVQRKCPKCSSRWEKRRMVACPGLGLPCSSYVS